VLLLLIRVMFAVYFKYVLVHYVSVVYANMWLLLLLLCMFGVFALQYSSSSLPRSAHRVLEFTTLAT
jgi:hypothetical protein